MGKNKLYTLDEAIDELERISCRSIRKLLLPASRDAMRQRKRYRENEKYREYHRKRARMADVSYQTIRDMNLFEGEHNGDNT